MSRTCPCLHSCTQITSGWLQEATVLTRCHSTDEETEAPGGGYFVLFWQHPPYFPVSLPTSWLGFRRGADCSFKTMQTAWKAWEATYCNPGAITLRMAFLFPIPSHPSNFPASSSSTDLLSMRPASSNCASAPKKLWHLCHSLLQEQRP